MAYGNPTGGSPGGGEEDLYSDSPEPAAEPKEGKENESGETTLIPKSMLMGKEFKVGEEVVFEVVGIHDDQVQVKYASEKKEGPPEQEAGPEPEGGGNPEMASMYS